MSGPRPVVRSTALLCGLLLLVGLLTATSSTASAVPQAAASAPKASAPRTNAPIATAATKYPGQPPSNYLPYEGARFGYLHRGRREQSRIRQQVLATIRSTWGGPRDANGLPLSTNGTIRIATWSFGDRGITKALFAAYKRGVSVQVMAAADINKTHPELRWLRKRLGTRRYRAGSYERTSFVRTCRGSCRGHGGTPHSKFFLFDNVGYAHHRRIVFQSSMNLTSFAWHGQWNSAQVTENDPSYDHFLAIFREMRPATYVASPYRSYTSGSITDLFFPFPSANSSTDPVMQLLNRVSCTGTTATSNGRARIRIIQYAIYQSRGEWIARKLRRLWEQGCDIQIIYAVTTRPALSILRSSSGRGPIPMKQSIIRGGEGTIVKYNHSKWMTIAGNYAGRSNAYITMAGSANWANLSLGSDEQMQILDSLTQVRAYNQNFGITWSQRTSGRPTLAYIADARVVGRTGGRVSVPLPEKDIPFGTGIYKYMTED